METVFEYSGTGCSTCGGGVDKLTAVKDPNQVKNDLPGTVYQYDAAGRLEYETDPIGKKFRYTYYDNGLVREKYDATTSQTLLVTYTYNNRGQLENKLFTDGTYEHFSYFPDGKLETAGNQNITYTYSYHDNGRLESVTDSRGYEIDYTGYNGLGQRTSVTYFAGSADQRTISYDYDGANRPWHLTSAAGIFTYSYDALGRRDTLSYPNTTVSDWDFDNLDRLTAVTHKISGGATFSSYAYPTHDQVDNIKSVSGDRSATYFYDEIYRVLNVAAAKSEAFTYDGTGNRLTGPGNKDTGALPADISYLYNNANQLSRGRRLEYDYDNAGNQTTKIVPGATDKSWTQIWNLQNQLVTVEKIKGSERRTVTFRYDPFGRRIEKKLETVLDGVTTTSTWKYVYDNEDIAMEILSDDSGESKTIFTHGPGIDEPLAMERDGAFYYYHADGLGSIAAITSSTPTVVQKYGYDTFGLVTPEAGFRNSYTYTGREWDSETGLYSYRARYYDPMEGRFISKDPIGFAGGDVNLYGYVLNNPINWIDPSGLLVSAFLNRKANTLTVWDVDTGVHITVPAFTGGAR